MHPEWLTAINFNTFVVLTFTGKLNIKHKVQVRTLRATHADTQYCSALFKYIKGLVIQLAEAVNDANPGVVVRFASLDDKAKVPAQPCVPSCTLYLLFRAYRSMWGSRHVPFRSVDEGD